MGVLAEDIERKIVERARNGDRSAMKQIYDCYVGYLTATCSRYLPDKGELRDVLQDSFVNIFSSLDKFTYRGEGSLKAWMTRIVVNDALKALRRKKPLPLSPVLSDITEDEVPDFDRIPLDVLQGMIRKLPEGYRTVFNLFVFEEKSHKEIASLLGIKENSSASQLHHAKALLARWIKDYIKHSDNG